MQSTKTKINNDNIQLHTHKLKHNKYAINNFKNKQMTYWGSKLTFLICGSQLELDQRGWNEEKGG